jgi:hypothetical protein
MAVKFTKPEINVREKLAEMDKPSGIAGEAMLRAETPQEQFNLIGAGRRNLLINGDFQVSQRGDYTTAGTAPNAYVLDRWICDRNGTATVQHTTGHDIPGTPAICKAVKLVQTVTGTNYLGIRQKIENPEQYIGRTFTYSAWIRSNTPNARIECYIPGTSPNVYVGPSHSGNGQWEYLSFTFTLNPGTPTAFHADVFIDNGSYSNITITAGEYLEATMLQLETGRAATPFEHRSYGEELALCRRYFQNVYNGQCFGSANTTTRMRINAPLSPEMRTNPTVARVAGTISFQGMGVGFNSTSTTVAQSSPSGPDFLGFDLAGFTSLTARAYAGSQSRTLVFTASAEL